MGAKRKQAERVSEIANMGIGDVVVALNNGEIASRSTMAGAWVAFSGDTIYIYFETGDGNLLSGKWRPTAADILATDWVVSERYEVAGRP